VLKIRTGFVRLTTRAVLRARRDRDGSCPARRRSIGELLAMGEEVTLSCTTSDSFRGTIMYMFCTVVVLIHCAPALASTVDTKKRERATAVQGRREKNREGAHAILSRAFKRTHRSLSSCTCFHTAPFPCFLLAYSLLLLKTRVQLNAVLSFSLQKRTRFVTVPDEIIG
jgi:hypothetical protein